MVLFSESTWVEFYRLIFGIDGVALSLMDVEEFKRFKGTTEFADIMERAKLLRENAPEPFREHMRVITVRMPETLYVNVNVAAREAGVSMNKYCVQSLFDSTTFLGGAAHDGEEKGGGKEGVNSSKCNGGIDRCRFCDGEKDS